MVSLESLESQVSQRKLMRYLKTSDSIFWDAGTRARLPKTGSVKIFLVKIQSQSFGINSVGTARPIPSEQYQFRSLSEQRESKDSHCNARRLMQLKVHN
jgi:hypothetical protein